jgi:ABC-type amino acid transport substrate-binding protein
VLKEAYKRIGYDVQFRMFPAKRSLNLANQGKSDGDIARIEGTEKAFPNLIALSTPIFNLQGYAYTIEVTRDIRDWSDLKGLRIGVVRGVRYATIGTKGLNPFFAEDMTHLFRLLADRRIDVAIAGRRSGQIEIHNNFKGSGIHTVGRSLYDKPMYHFVHKKNKELAVRLNHALENMAAEGRIDTIIKKTFEMLLGGQQGNL